MLLDAHSFQSVVARYRLTSSAIDSRTRPMRRPFFVILPAVACFLSCARGSSQRVDEDPLFSLVDAARDPSDAGAFLPDGAILTADGAILSIDGAVASLDAAVRDGSALSDAATSDGNVGDAGCSGRVVINELQVEGPTSAADEFIEIHNPNACDVAVGGWAIEYRSRVGATATILYRFPSAARLAPGAYFVLAGLTFSGPKDIVFSFTLDGTSGQIGILDGTRVVDGVGYGNASGGLVEGAPAVAPPGGQSLARRLGGIDTDSNAADFRVQSPTPRGPNPP